MKYLFLIFFMVLLAHRLTTAQAARRFAQQIDDEIARNIAADPGLRILVEELEQFQRKIDALRAAQQPVPRDLITNPFCRAHCAHMGWLADE